MPIYEYECSKCEQITEAVQKISEPPLETCPQCGGTLSKLISRTSFQLKGSGWYKSGYQKASSSSTDTKTTSSGEAKATPAPVVPPKPKGDGDS